MSTQSANTLSIDADLRAFHLPHATLRIGVAFFLFTALAIGVAHQSRTTLLVAGTLFGRLAFVVNASHRARTVRVFCTRGGWNIAEVRRCGTLGRAARNQEKDSKCSGCSKKKMVDVADSH